MTETFCKVVTEIIEVKEVTVTRKIVVKAHSMEDSDEAIYHQSEYSEGLPVRTVTEKSCGSSIEVVPLSSLSLKQQAKGSHFSVTCLSFFAGFIPSTSKYFNIA